MHAMQLAFLPGFWPRLPEESPVAASCTSPPAAGAGRPSSPSP